MARYLVERTFPDGLAIPMSDEGAQVCLTVVGIFTGVTGTLVRTFFGIQIGSMGSEQEREERKKWRGNKMFGKWVGCDKPMDNSTIVIQFNCDTIDSIAIQDVYFYLTGNLCCDGTREDPHHCRVV